TRPHAGGAGEGSAHLQPSAGGGRPTRRRYRRDRAWRPALPGSACLPRECRYKPGGRLPGPGARQGRGGRMASLISTLPQPLAAESVKLRRGTLPRLPLLGLLAALLEGVLFLVSPYAVHSWTMLSAWHVVWVTFLSPVALALLAGLAAQQEARARWG